MKAYFYLQAVKEFGEKRSFHDPNDSEIDSEFSEGEEIFDYAKGRFNLRSNQSIENFTNAYTQIWLVQKFPLLI